MLAIYCSAWDEGGAERWKLDNQEQRGLRYAFSFNLKAKDCVIYRDTLVERGKKRQDYERLRQDIADGKISEVWARGNTQLYLNKGEKEAFQALCQSKGVKVCFGKEFRLGLT